MCEHVLVDTGQNYDANLRDVFFDELSIREPDYKLGAMGSFGQQLGIIASKLEDVLLNEKPDVFLVLGDTNSSLGAIIAKRLGIKVFHMEAGNRCYDDRVPEEVNRRIIDHSSDILLPYTERSRQNLLAEGIPGQRIYVTGNPIKEVLDRFNTQTFESEYYLITLHREENVDNAKRLGRFIVAFNQLDRPSIWSVHPRTMKKLKSYTISPKVKVIEPMGFKEFTALEKNAHCVLTDSGTVQEECAIFGTPVVTLRDSTERPETIEVGSNVISGCEPEAIARGIKVALASKGRIPAEYLIDNVSDTVIKILMSYW